MTSRTIFASHKLSFCQMLHAIAIFINGAKGVAALHLSRQLDVQFKTAFILEKKLREAMQGLQQALKLEGEVEVDGAYFGGYLKPANVKKNRINRNKKAYKTGLRQCAVIIRERNGRSMPFIGRVEADALPKIASVVSPGSILFADSAPDYNALHALFLTKRINHEERYAEDGVSTNQAESFFSRARRMEIGTHHHIAGAYLAGYINEASWREDNRRLSNGEQFLVLATAALHHPISIWKGYWQWRKNDGLDHNRPRPKLIRRKDFSPTHP